MISINTGYGGSEVLVTDNSYEYIKLKEIVMLPKNDGDVLTWKDGKYQWRPIRSVFTAYTSAIEK